MLTWVWPDDTLVDILCTSAALVPWGADTVELAIDGVRVTLSSHLARVAGAGIINVTQQTSLAGRAAANEGSHAVDASGAGSAGLSCAVINVFRAVRAAPAVHTYAVVAVACVTARASVLTGVGLQSAFIHVIGAKLTSPFRWTLAAVSVHSVNACGSILTVVILTIINVYFTVCSSKTWQAEAYISCVCHLLADSTIEAGG